MVNSQLSLSLSTPLKTQSKHHRALSFFILRQPRQVTLHLTRLPPSFFVSNSQKPSSLYPISLFPQANQRVAAIVFGDGSTEPNSGLYPLTKRRSQGALPIAANYRLVDVVISNCINSQINKIFALTQFNSTSLNSHLSRAYSGSALGNHGFVEVIAACQSPDDHSWFQGDADAVRRCLWILEENPAVTEFLILPGYHLYEMDYQKLIEAHRTSNANITIAASTSMKTHDPGFGFLHLDSSNHVLDFILHNSNSSNQFNLTPGRSSNKYFKSQGNYSSMGIYLIKRETMIKLLREHFPMAKDFATQIIPGAMSLGMKVEAFLFEGYWEDMKSIEAFYKANMDCTKKEKGFSFHDRDNLVYTLPRCLPPSVVSNAVIIDSIVGDGCILNRCEIKGAVIGMRTRVGDGALIEDSVVMGSDCYEREDVQNNGMDGKSPDIPIGIGGNTHIKRAIIDKNVRIGQNVKIINKDNVQEGDRGSNGYMIRAGIVVVLRGALIPNGIIL